MRKIILGLTLLASMSSFASESTINCHFDGGGYDDETISVTISGRRIDSLNYLSFQGPVGPFKKVGDSLFEHSTKELIINYIISLSDDLTNANLTVVYKNGGKVLTAQHFKCY